MVLCVFLALLAVPTTIIGSICHIIAEKNKEGNKEVHKLFSHIATVLAIPANHLFIRHQTSWKQNNYRGFRHD